MGILDYMCFIKEATHNSSGFKMPCWHRPDTLLTPSASGRCQQGIRTQSCCRKVVAKHNPRSERVQAECMQAHTHTKSKHFLWIQICFDSVCSALRSRIMLCCHLPASGRCQQGIWDPDKLWVAPLQKPTPPTTYLPTYLPPSPIVHNMLEGWEVGGWCVVVGVWRFWHMKKRLIIHLDEIKIWVRPSTH